MDVALARLDGKGVYIRPLEVTDAQAMTDLRVSNRDFLTPFEPARSERFYTLESQREFIQYGLHDWQAGDAFAFGIFLDEDDRLIGRVALSNVVRGAWQNATLGYFIDRDSTGNGFATEAVRLSLEFAFEHASLHRVQAGVMLRNRASARVLEKNGFRNEGMSPRYLRINGRWEDHDMYAITAEEW